MTAPLYVDRLAHAVGAAHVSVDGERVTVRPGAPAEIADVVRIAGEVSATVGIGVADGVALDLGRMRNVLHLDETSLLVEVQAGLTVEQLEIVLAERGLTLGPVPHSSRARTVGALLSAPRPSEAAPRTGRLTATCAGIAAVLADATALSTRVAPRKATGPDLMHALVGARGTLGLITAATLRVQRRAEMRHEAAWRR
jgi:alkyldihydroxyacetonephosphate synthase